jgi:hypothetical protein
MHAAVRIGDAAGGVGRVAAGGPFKECLADLGAARVVQADEENVAHVSLALLRRSAGRRRGSLAEMAREPYSIDKYHFNRYL